MTVVAKWHGAKATAAEKKGAARGLMLGAEHVLTEANKIVPIEEATLLRSGVASMDEGALQAAVSYDTVYAVRQHEELTWRHDAGRQAKYLETPINSERAAVQALIAREIKASLG
jgi:di/tripeptidase